MKKLFYLILLLLFTISCEKESPVEREKILRPELPNETLIKISEPVNAPAVVLDYFNDAHKDINFTFNNFNQVKDKSPVYKSPDWTWSYDLGGWTISMIATVLDEDDVTWIVIVNYNDSRDPWTISAGKTNLDGRSGSSWQFFKTNSSIENSTAEWQQGNILTFFVQDMENQKYELVGRPDGSRSLNVSLSAGTTIFKADWSSLSGTGSWTTYNGSTGLQTGSGSW